MGKYSHGMKLKAFSTAPTTAIVQKEIKMPISKEKKKLYPADWKQISARIREKAKNKCEFCGAENYKPHPITGSKVVLTVAHLDHTPQNCSDENLRALCQKCHLTYDAKHHAENARKTRDNRLGIIRIKYERR